MVDWGNLKKKIRSLLVAGLASILVASAPLGANATEGRVTYLVMPKEGSSQEVRGAISVLGEYPEDQFVLVGDLIASRGRISFGHKSTY